MFKNNVKLDAVRASKFITLSQSEELIQRIRIWTIKTEKGASNEKCIYGRNRTI